MDSSKKRRQSYLPVCGTARSAYYATIKDLFDRFHNKPSNKKYEINLRPTFLQNILHQKRVTPKFLHQIFFTPNFYKHKMFTTKFLRKIFFTPQTFLYTKLRQQCLRLIFLCQIFFTPKTFLHRNLI